MRKKRMPWVEPAESGPSSFEWGGCVAYLKDCRKHSWPQRCDVLVFDPPWDDRDAWNVDVSDFGACLAFCDGKYAGEAVKRFGPPRWVFVWDTMSTWSSSSSAPLNGCKLCLLFGDAPWNRDEALYGEPPPSKKHPSTQYSPLSGRRLSDLYRKSLRWQSNASASGASDKPPHAKPDEWVRALVCGVGVRGGLLCDPFMGGGASLVAATSAGMSEIATELNPSVFHWTRKRLADSRESHREQMSLFSGDQ